MCPSTQTLTENSTLSSKRMKRLLIILSAIVLLTSACQKETRVDIPATLTYTIVPEVSFVVKSGDETAQTVNPAVNSLSCKVYHKKTNANGEYYYDYIKEMGAYVPITDASDISVPITLIKDQEYKLVFIAQHRFEAQQRTNAYAYTVSDDGVMSVNTAAPFTSGEQLEAFAYVDEVGPITGNENRSIKLNRVVSQVNIGTSSNDRPSALNIAVSGAAAEYDILNNVYSDSSNELNFGFAVPSGKISVSGTEYNSLATLYCLGSNSLALTLTNADSADDTFSINNVATKVNYKTNIVGNIELARPVASVGVTVYSTLAAAARAAEAGSEKTITLLQDVTLADPVTLPAGVTFNGNDHQITGTLIAGGSLTFAGHTKVEKFIADCNGYTITIPEGACLEINGDEPFKVGYGNTFIIGSTEVVSANPSLIIPAGILIEGTSGDNFQFWNTKVQLGSIISDPDKASGTFNFNLTTSEATIAGKIDLAAPTNGKTPIYHITLAQSELTTVGDFYIGAPGTQNNPTTLVLTSSTMNVGGTYTNNGIEDIDANSTLTSGHPNVIPSEHSTPTSLRGSKSRGNP